MFIITYLLTSLLAADGDAMTKQELLVAIASLEESLSSRPTIEASYSTTVAWTKAGETLKRQVPNGKNCNWIRKPDRDYFSESTNDNANVPILKWYYDGKNTREWWYVRGSAELSSISVALGAPRFPIRENNGLAYLLGWERDDGQDGIVHYLKDAIRSNTVAGVKQNDSYSLSLGRHKLNGNDIIISATLDPKHNNRLTSWSLEQPGSAGQESDFWHYVVDEFREVEDEASGARVSFPHRAHNENAYTITRIEVHNVRINHSVPDSVFVGPQAPLGVTLLESSATPGIPPKASVVGGELGYKHRMQNLIEKGNAELDRLKANGVTFDGTPPQKVTGLWWAVVGGSLLLLVCLRWLYQRRR